MKMWRDCIAQASTFFCSAAGAATGVVVALPIAMYLGQYLIDSSDDEVVSWTCSYYEYAAWAFCLACCAVGYVAGGLFGREIFRHDPPLP